VLALTFWVAPAFVPAQSVFGVGIAGWAVQLGLAVLAATYLAVRTDHGGGRVLAFAVTTVLGFLVVGLALSYPVNEPGTPASVVVPCWLFGLSVGYTVWLGDGLTRVRERLERRVADN
jgi:hypothetical protein